MFSDLAAVRPSPTRFRGLQSLQVATNELKNFFFNFVVITVLHYREVLQEVSCGEAAKLLNTALPPPIPLQCKIVLVTCRKTR